MRDRKGLMELSTSTLIGIALGIAAIIVIWGVVYPLITNAGNVGEGCTAMASVLSDATSGAMEVC